MSAVAVEFFFEKRNVLSLSMLIVREKEPSAFLVICTALLVEASGRYQHSGSTRV